MIIYLRKQPYAHTTDYQVVNDQGIQLFTAKGDLLYTETRLHLLDARGNEVVNIVETTVKEQTVFEIKINGIIAATVHKEETWRHRTFVVDGSKGHYSVSQDFSGTEFQVTRNNSHFGTIKKEEGAMREAYLLELDKEQEQENLDFFVAMLLAVAIFNDREELRIKEEREAQK